MTTTNDDELGTLCTELATTDPVTTAISECLIAFSVKMNVRRQYSRLQDMYTGNHNHNEEECMNT